MHSRILYRPKKVWALHLKENLQDEKRPVKIINTTLVSKSTQTSFFLLLQGEFRERIFCGKFSGKSREGRGLRQNQTKNVRYELG